jgi:hypothetical protein
MPLTYNFSHVAGWKDLCLTPQGNLSLITSAIIWSLCTVHMTRVSEENCDRVFERISMLEDVVGPVLRDEKGKKKYLSLSDLRDHVGLSTNVKRRKDAYFEKALLYTLKNRASVRHAEQAESLRLLAANPLPEFRGLYTSPANSGQAQE